MTMFPADTGDLRSRFTFRNDTDASLTAHGLFDFTKTRCSRFINSVTEWCSTYQSTTSFCSQDYYAPQDESGATVVDSNVNKTRLTIKRMPCVVGAMTAFGVVALLAVAACFAHRTRSKPVERPAVDKKASGSEAGSRISV